MHFPLRNTGLNCIKLCHFSTIWPDILHHRFYFTLHFFNNLYKGFSIYRNKLQENKLLYFQKMTTKSYYTILSNILWRKALTFKKGCAIGHHMEIKQKKLWEQLQITHTKENS